MRFKSLFSCSLSTPFLAIVTDQLTDKQHKDRAFRLPLQTSSKKRRNANQLSKYSGPIDRQDWASHVAIIKIKFTYHHTLNDTSMLLQSTPWTFSISKYKLFTHYPVMRCVARWVWGWLVRWQAGVWRLGTGHNPDTGPVAAGTMAGVVLAWAN